MALACYQVGIGHTEAGQGRAGLGKEGSAGQGRAGLGRTRQRRAGRVARGAPRRPPHLICILMSERSSCASLPSSSAEDPAVRAGRHPATHSTANQCLKGSHRHQMIPDGIKTHVENLSNRCQSAVHTGVPVVAASQRLDHCHLCRLDAPAAGSPSGRHWGSDCTRAALPMPWHATPVPAAS